MLLADYDPGVVLAQLEDGLTIPTRWYTDDAVFEAERGHVFRRAWHYACPASSVRAPGDYYAYMYGGIPLVVVRDADGVLRAFINVCRHRGHEVAAGCGNRQSFKCPYHQWTYRLDGTLRSAPRVSPEPGFDAADLSLIEVAVASRGPLVLVSADPAAPSLGAELDHFEAIVRSTGLDLGALAFEAQLSWEMQGNWKIALENYLECYHCTSNHKSFCDVMGSRDGDMELGIEGELFWGVMRRQGTPSVEPYPLAGPVEDFTISYLWPAVTITTFVGPPNLLISNWDPVSPTRSLRRSDWYFAPDVPDETKSRMKVWLDELGQEDITLVESVNRGFGSAAIETGRLYQEDDLVGEFQKRLTQAFIDIEPARAANGSQPTSAKGPM